MTAFTQIPLGVLTDTTLSVEARVTYSVITYFAWKAGRQRGEETHGVLLPPLNEICAQLGTSRTTVKRHLRELKQARLVATSRQGNEGSIYFLFDAPASEDEYRRVTKTTPTGRATSGPSGTTGRATDGPQVGPHVDPHDAALPYMGLESTKKDDLSVVRARPVPPDVTVDGQNLPLNAIVEVCDIDPASRHRFPEIQKCLTGGKRAGSGIRDLFWVECLRHAEANDLWHVLDAMTPEQYACVLAEAIHRKAATYRSVMPEGTTLTPTALHKWWLDVEKKRQSTRTVPSTLEEFEQIYG